MWRFVRFGALALIALALNGCALALSALGSGAGTGAGMGLQHNVTGVVSKTYMASLPELRAAMLGTLERMSVGVEEDKQTEEGWLITGKARDRDISLRLQELTPNTIRARVAVDNDTLFKDTATAEEILAQTSRALDDAATAQAEANQERTKPFAKKMGSRQIPRVPTKAAGAKTPPPVLATKVAVAGEPGSGPITPNASPVMTVSKTPQKLAFAKEHP